MQISFSLRESDWGNKLFSRVGCMPSHRGLTGNRLKAISAGSCLMIVMSGLLHLQNKKYFLFFILICLYIFLLSIHPSGPLFIYYGFQFNVFIGLLSVQMSESVSYVSSWAISFCLFVLFNSTVLVFGLSYLLNFIIIP